jgi:hypothetical protein
MRRCKLHRRQRHILRQVLRVVHEVLLELHALLPHMFLLLLLLLRSVGLLQLLLLLLLFLSFFLLQCCSVSLRKLFRRWLFLPAPLLFEFFVDEPDSPACFLVDFLEDLQTFFLLLPVCENFACVCKGSNGYGGDTTAIYVSISSQKIINNQAHRSFTWAAIPHIICACVRCISAISPGTPTLRYGLICDSSSIAVW